MTARAAAILLGLAQALVGTTAPAQQGRPGPQGLFPDAKPVPQVQVLPLPDDQASFEIRGREVTRYHYGARNKRTFLYPIVGPSGRSLTRMGHPRDPQGHAHHNSVWVAHQDVDGENFWEDPGDARIVHRRVLRFEDDNDEGDQARMVVENAWVGADGRDRLIERRALTVLSAGERLWLLLIDLEFRAVSGPATLGATAFGPIGVRMAKSIGVDDGGGLIRNSEGKVNEQGDDGAFRKPARWVDYSGPIAPDKPVEGITLFDHPGNPGHPNPFHVRADGWMGVSPGLKGPTTIEPGRPLRLRYGLLVHGGAPDRANIEAYWQDFAARPLPDLSGD